MPPDLADLIERVLPLDRLPKTRRMGGYGRVRAASDRTSTPTPNLSRATSAAIIEVDHPAMPATRSTATEPPARTASSAAHTSVTTVARATLPETARVASGQIQRLLRLGDPMLASDPRLGEARSDLIRHLERAAAEVLGEVHVRLLAADATDTTARAAQATPEAILCEDVADGRARAWLGLVSARGEPLGVLEVSDLEDCGESQLARVALLGDYAAGVLERAARVENLVFVDPMTGTYNRSYFEIQMSNEIARAERDATGMALCIADIDDFKSFNTRFGYEGGNEVLVRVAQAFRSGVRPFDTVARWGGEEFAVLLSAPVQAQDVVTVAERLRGMVERMTVPIAALDGTIRHVRVTVSIGAALFPDHGGDPTAMWRAANVALLEAKRPPKNRVVFGGAGEPR